MTTSVNGSATAAAGPSVPATAAGTAREVLSPRSPLPTRQRRPGLAAVGLIVVLGMGAVFGWLYTTAGEKTPVVVMAREVPVGQVIERADLSTVDVAGSVTAIAGTNLSSAVGQRAAVGLIPGTLLQRGMLTGADTIPAGWVQVGVALKAGQLPADGVHAGDKVAAVRLGGNAAGAAQPTNAPAAATVLADAATVYSVRVDPTQTGGSLVTLVVTPEQGLAIAEASSTGNAALIKVPSP
ncbi:MAG TPA: SAF domain-containing protein [Nakamurella sp.]